MRVQGGFVGLFWFVETEFVIPTVLGTGQLLDQEHHGVVESAQHPQTAHTYRTKGQGAKCSATRKLYGINKWFCQRVAAQGYPGSGTSDI